MQIPLSAPAHFRAPAPQAASPPLLPVQVQEATDPKYHLRLLWEGFLFLELPVCTLSFRPLCASCVFSQVLFPLSEAAPAPQGPRQVRFLYLRCQGYTPQDEALFLPWLFWLFRAPCSKAPGTQRSFCWKYRSRPLCCRIYLRTCAPQAVQRLTGQRQNRLQAHSFCPADVKPLKFCRLLFFLFWLREDLPSQSLQRLLFFSAACWNHPDPI